MYTPNYNNARKLGPVSHRADSGGFRKKAVKKGANCLTPFASMSRIKTTLQIPRYQNALQEYTSYVHDKM